MVKLSETAMLLVERYGSIHLLADEVAEVMGWKSGKSVLNAISGDRFPVPSMKLGKRRVVDVRDMADWLDAKRQASAQSIRARGGYSVSKTPSLNAQ